VAIPLSLPIPWYGKLATFFGIFVAIAIVTSVIRYRSSLRDVR
jgi:hypothetical protein